LKLAIISHTEHYQDKTGNIVGWGPTISEINHLADHFNYIYHLGFFYEEAPKKSSLPYSKSNIEFVSLPVSGGKTIWDKLGVLAVMPKLISKVNQYLKKVDVFQFRTPIGFGVYLIPYLSMMSNKKGWFKYAGNWNQKNPPLGYALQRYFLKKQARKVTINGKWSDQPKHCLTFENPCLTNQERHLGEELIREKDYLPPYEFCFVGRLEDEKGVQRILDALKKIDHSAFIKKIHLIGDGQKKGYYEKQINKNKLPVKLHGFLSREQVFKIYKRSHFLLLPTTASEGFPKVIAEAVNYGCIPIVSGVSSIGQYINNENAFMVEPTNADKLTQILKTIDKASVDDLKNKVRLCNEIAQYFTFEYYISRIKRNILE